MVAVLTFWEEQLKMKARGCILSITVAVLVVGQAMAQTDTADFASVRRIVAVRCAICHSAIPQEDGLNAGSQPPKGVKFDSAADIHKFAQQILEQAVKSRQMPPDNATHMSDEERTVLGKWIEAGAKTP